MIIDFHTHMFPDNLAERTISHLAEKSGFKPYSDATENGNIHAMDKYGIDTSVVCNIATNSKQTENVNKFAVRINQNERFVSFGSVHPDCDYIYFLDFLKDNNIKGIKLHPDYQNFFIDDKKMRKIYEEILKRDFVLIFHTGVDDGIGEPTHATPERIKNIIGMFRGEKVVLAHMGGFKMWESVCENLLGEDVFFDTSCNEHYIPFDVFENIVKTHKPEKILFGTDMPWTNPTNGIEVINKLNITQAEKDNILGGNAKKLLGLE